MCVCVCKKDSCGIMVIFVEHGHGDSILNF